MFLSFSFLILILYLPFHEMHKHFMFGSTSCQLIEELRPLISNPLAFFCFSFFILILCLSVHETHKDVLVWEHVVSAQEAATAFNKETLGIFLFLVVHINFMYSCS